MQTDTNFKLTHPGKAMPEKKILHASECKYKNLVRVNLSDFNLRKNILVNSVGIDFFPAGV